jgi:predicted negative regulator of RcsB-dependent stress response
MKKIVDWFKHWFKEHGVELICFGVLILAFYQILLLIL